MKKEKIIQRTFQRTTVFPSTVKMENDELISDALPSITVDGTISEEKAIALVKKTYGSKNQYVIRKIETENTTYGITVSDFMKLAFKVETENAETAQGEK